MIGNWVRARGIGVRHGVNFMSAGQVDKLKLDIIKNVLVQGLVPIFPNIGWNARGRPYNISSIELSATLSRQLAAEKLFFVIGPQHLDEQHYRLPDGLDYREDGTVSRLTLSESELVLELNRERENDTLLDLIGQACACCQAGVKRVHIIDGSVEGVILKEIFSNRGCGTMVYADEHANIRGLRFADIPEVLRIMQPLVDRQVLIPRSSRFLEEQCDDFVVYEVDGMIHAAGALHLFEGQKAEIAGIAVDGTYSSMGIGQKILSFLIGRARELHLTQVFVLTTQTFDWFLELGFRQGSKDQLPAGKLDRYDEKRNSVVLYFDL